MPSLCRNASLRALGMRFTSRSGNAGSWLPAESLKEKMINLCQTLPRASPESGSAAIRPGRPQQHPLPYRLRDQGEVGSVDVDVDKT